MKLINIYLIGHYIYAIYIISTSPIKYIPWNNEIISWGLRWLWMSAFWLAAFLENGLGTGNGYGVLWKLLGIVYGIIVGCLIYNLLPQQNKK